MTSTLSEAIAAIDGSGSGSGSGGEGDAQEKAARYTRLLEQTAAKSATGDLHALLSHLATERVPLAVSRPALGAFAARALPLLPAPAPRRAAAEHALAAMGGGGRGAAFEAQIRGVRMALSALCEAEGDLRGAAEQLSSVLAESARPSDGESGGESSAEEASAKVDLCVRIAQLQLRLGDADAAAAAVLRASDAALALGAKPVPAAVRYRATYASVLDRKGEFLKAAQRYHELSQLAPAVMGDGERRDALGRAATCAVLAEAGPERSRMLASLCKDERTHALPVHAFLQRVHRDRVLRPAEIDAFARTLEPHQRERLAQAVVQHNLLSASRVYDNIAFDELGRLLGIPAPEAERVAARMIAERRIEGAIDQVAGLIIFGAPDAIDDERARAIAAWDAQIQAVCDLANAATDSILAKYPQLKQIA